MDFISDIRKQVNSYQSTDDKYSAPLKSNGIGTTTTSIRIDDSLKYSDIPKSIEIPDEPQKNNNTTPKNKSSLDFFLSELENRNFFNNKIKEQQRIEQLDKVREEVVNKLKELHIENKLNPVFIKELLSAIEVTYKKFKEDVNLDPDNYYNACLSYIDSRRPQNSDYRSHVDF